MTQNNCTSCDINTNHRGPIPNCNCLDKYYNNAADPVCLACHFSCAKCNAAGSTSCTSCNSAKQRTYSSGSCLCRTGYFDDATNEVCPQCSYKCLTCSTSLDHC